MQQQGYDKLSEDTQKTLDDTIKVIQGNADEQERIVSLMLDKIKNNYDTVYGEIDKTIADTGTVVSDNTTKTINEFKSSTSALIASVKSNIVNTFTALPSQITQEISTNPIDIKITYNGQSIDEIDKRINQIAQKEKADVAASENVKGLINNIKSGDKTSITNARNAYNKLTADQKALIDSDIYKKLTDAEAALKKAEEAATAAAAQKKAEEELAKKKAEESEKMVQDNIKRQQQLLAEQEELRQQELRKQSQQANDAAAKAAGKTFTGSGVDTVTLSSNLSGPTAKTGTTSYASASSGTSTTKSTTKTNGVADEKLKAEKNRVKSVLDTYKVSSPHSGKLSKAEEGYNELYKHIARDLKIKPSTNLYKALASAMNMKVTVKDGKLIASDRDKILNKLKSYGKGYAKGTLGTKKDELNWTHQGEIIRRSDGAILRQLPAGTQVVPKIESANLMKWGTIDPNKFFADALRSMPDGNNVNTNTVVNNYEALIKVEGDVNADVMDRLENLAQQLLANRTFQNGTTNMVTKNLTKEMGKLGYKR